MSTVLLLCLVHTADTAITRLSCFVMSVSAVWTELETSQDYRRQKISKLNMFSILQFCRVSKLRDSTKLFSLKYWGLLKTVLSCRQFSSHRQHGQNKTFSCCPCRRCELGISDCVCCIPARAVGQVPLVGSGCRPATWCGLDFHPRAMTWLLLETWSESAWPC